MTTTAPAPAPTPGIGSLDYRATDTRKTYVAQYMNGKTRRFSCFSYAEAVTKAHASRRAVADISEL